MCQPASQQSQSKGKVLDSFETCLSFGDWMEHAVHPYVYPYLEF